MPFPLVTVLLVIGAVLFSASSVLVTSVGAAILGAAFILQFWLQVESPELEISENSSPPDEY